MDQLEITLIYVAFTDFTNMSYEGGSWTGRFMVIIGHTSKYIFGWSVGKTRSNDLAEEALDRTLEKFDRKGTDPDEVILHQDLDSLYTE